MSDEMTTVEPAGDINVVSVGADAPDSFNSPSSAAKYLASLRHRKESPAESAPEAAATAEPESVSQETDTAPTIEAGTTVEDQGAEPELPAIEPPRSWSKDAHERWSKLDRETQEFLASRDSEDQKAIKRSLQEAAEVRKAAEAEQTKAKQEREQYVAKQSAYTQALETALQNEFGDIRSMDDVRKLQAEDPFRFQQWQLRQMELGQAKAEQQENERQSAAERQNEWAKFTKEESEAFENDVPEFKAKKDEYTKKAAEVLVELGFSNDELGKLASGKEKISLFDRRMQRLLFDRIRLSEIKAAVPKAMPKPVPPVQRPGPAAPRGAAQAADLRSLNQRLTESGDVKDAVALYLARQKAS